jgi:hypothetical protein
MSGSAPGGDGAAPLPQPPCPAASVISSPAQRMDSDFRHFALLDDAVYAWCHLARSYCLVVPEGFHHDFASVPRLLWGLIAPIDLGMASIFHDWLYRNGGEVTTLLWEGDPACWTPHSDRWTREQADRLFARIMREQGVAKWRRRCAYLAVRFWGRRFWKRRALRSSR